MQGVGFEKNLTVNNKRTGVVMVKLRRSDTLELPIFIHDEAHINQETVTSDIFPGEVLKSICVMRTFDLQESLEQVTQCSSLKLVGFVKNIQKMADLVVGS